MAEHSLIYILLFILLYIYLPMKMARKRGRSAFGWILVFWILNALLGIILLLILGKRKQNIKEDLIKELKQDQ